MKKSIAQYYYERAFNDEEMTPELLGEHCDEKAQDFLYEELSNRKERGTYTFKDQSKLIVNITNCYIFRLKVT